MCFQFRIITIEYFMDDCTDWELNNLIENIQYLDRNLWESSRLNSYVTAQVNSRKKISFQDICTFKWEEKETEDIEISDDDIQRLKQLSRIWKD